MEDRGAVHIMKGLSEDNKFLSLCGEKIETPAVIATYAKAATCKECIMIKVEEKK